MVLGAGIAAATTPPIPRWALVAYAVVVGVGIDLDHFLIARWNAGDWRAVRGCLRRPRVVFVEQEAIFETLDVLVLQRLLSHAVIGGLLVCALAPASPYLAVVTAAVLYAHVVADLVWDNRRFEETARRYVRAVDGAGDGGAEGDRRVEGDEGAENNGGVESDGGDADGEGSADGAGGSAPR